MNERELFHKIMGFETSAASLKLEMGYWGGTLKKWYRQGLPRKNPVKVPKDIKTISSSINTFLFNHLAAQQGEEIPDGSIVWGSALYWPTQGFALDRDINDYFSLNTYQRKIDVEMFFYPHFNPEILNEDLDSIIYIDIDGIKRKYNKKNQHMPVAMAWPVTDIKDWQAIKEDHLSLKNISKRFPKDWEEQIKEYKAREYILSLGGYPLGLFGTIAHFLGHKNLFYFLYDMKELIKDMLETFTNLWISIWEEILYKVEIDIVHLWEDISIGKSVMISPYAFRELMLPYYKKITSFLKSKNVKNIMIDTDGDCREVIPLFLKAGITGIYPLEVSSGIDLIKLRNMYPRLQMMGGISKYDLSFGKEKIDSALGVTKKLLSLGGYVPFIENLITSDISWSNFSYYRKGLNNIVDGFSN